MIDRCTPFCADIVQKELDGEVIVAMAHITSALDDDDDLEQDDDLYQRVDRHYDTVAWTSAHPDGMFLSDFYK